MITRNIQNVLTLLVVAIVTLGAPGCFLKVLSGIADEVDGSLIITAENSSMTTTCVDEGSPGGFIECTYLIDDPNGAFEITSTALLISEFGLFGVIVDPLILQIPVGAIGVTGTYDDGAGNSGALVVRSGYKSIPVDYNRHLFAERRQQFAIVELPEGLAVQDVDYDFTLSFALPPGSSAPVQVKAMLALKFTAGFGGNEYEFYSPLLPCTTDMVAVSPLAIPGGSGDPVPIEVPTNPAGCVSEEYLYLGFGVFPCDFDGDDDVDRDDLRLQASVRNAPALKGDRLDANHDGHIDLNDVRRCALQCTTPQCESQFAEMLKGEDLS